MLEAQRVSPLLLGSERTQCYTTCDNLAYPVSTHHLCRNSWPRIDRQVHRILNLLIITGNLASQHKQCSYSLRYINDYLLAIVIVDFIYRELWYSSLCSHANYVTQRPFCSRTKGSLSQLGFDKSIKLQVTNDGLGERGSLLGFPERGQGRRKRLCHD